MKYYFILGKNPELSFAEIKVVLGNEFQFSLKNSVLIAEGSKDLNLTELQNRLGGTIKTGVIVATSKKNSLEKDLEPLISQYLPFEGKFYFGISVYESGMTLNQKDIEKIGLALKKFIKKQHLSCRFVTSKEKILSSVIVKKNHLLDESGKEIVLIQNVDHFLIGLTSTVQDFFDYSTRDYGRPSRDDFSGMIPPKLAQMMINLSGAGKDDFILDPFCGSGTILQEAALMGYKKIVGSDISDKAISDSKENLKWLLKEKADEIKIFQADVRQIGKHFSGREVDAVVAEPYLGPALKSVPSQKQAESIVFDLEKLYIDAFLGLSSVLKSKAKVVMVFPIFKIGDNLVKLNIENSLKKQGFNEIRFDTPLVYQRETHKILREIKIFQYT